MRGALLFLVLVVVFLSWKFVFSPDKLEFTDRAKVLQGLALALDHKQAVRAYWKQNGRLPEAGDWRADAVQVDLGQSIVEAIRVGEEGAGVITVHYGARPGQEVPPAVAGKRIRLVPGVLDGRLDWRCEGTVPEKYLPRKCTVLPEPVKADKK